jgi:hypothetical protein
MKGGDDDMVMMNEEDMNIFLNKKVSIQTIDGLFFTVTIDKVEDGKIAGLDKYEEPIVIMISDISRCFVVSGTQLRRW